MTSAHCDVEILGVLVRKNETWLYWTFSPAYCYAYIIHATLKFMETAVCMNCFTSYVCCLLRKINKCFWTTVDRYVVAPHCHVNVYGKPFSPLVNICRYLQLFTDTFNYRNCRYLQTNGRCMHLIEDICKLEM